jgi:hypothetical protein
MVVLVSQYTGCFIRTVLKYGIITYMLANTNGPKNTPKSLLRPLHFKILPPKIANKLVSFFAGTIPFNIKIFLIFKNTQVILSLQVSKVHISHAKQYCGNFHFCIKWQISENAM